MRKRVCYVLICVLARFFLSAQELATIEGSVHDKDARPIGYASIYLSNTNFFTSTDSAGSFSIRNIPAGDYVIVISAVGYATIDENLQLVPGKKASIIFQLEDVSKQLDEVIISAEKKQENLQAVPFAVSALSARNVQEYRLWNVHELTAIVPNLYSANPGDGRNVTSIRGVTSSSYDPAVTTYIDGVNQFTLDTYMPQLFDVDRIEVLRGPQGTLYGRNAMGGVINIATKLPSDKTDGSIELNIGDYGEQRYIGTVRTPVVKDKLFLGAALLYEVLNGYYKNEYNNTDFDRQHSFGGNYYLKYVASNRWAITANAKNLLNRNYGSFPLAASKDEAFAKPFVVNQNAVANLVDNTLNLSLAANYTGQQFNFSSQTGYQSNYRYYTNPLDADFSPADAITIINNYGHDWNKVKVLTQEFRFTSPASSKSPLDWTAGSYLFYQDVPNKQATHFGKDAALVGSPDSNYAIINTTKATSAGLAFYGQVSYAISKKLELKMGLRYDYQHSREGVQGEYQPDASPVPIFETQPDTSGNVSFHAFSPMVSLAYSPSSTTNLYAIYSRGYRAGGLTQLGADPSQPPLYPYQPEYSDNFEVGAKNTFFDNAFRANVAIFFTNISDVQVPTLILPSAITVTKNAGSLQTKGLDMEIASTLVRGLEATYNLGYTDAKYTRLRLSQNGSEVDLTGNRQIFTPDITSLLALQYTAQVSRPGKIQLIARGEWTYLGKEYFDLANTINQSSYNLFNARIGLTTKYASLYFWERNIGNVKYIAYAYDFGAVHLGNPRTVGATVRLTL